MCALREGLNEAVDFGHDVVAVEREANVGRAGGVQVFDDDDALGGQALNELIRSRRIDWRAEGDDWPQGIDRGDHIEAQRRQPRNSVAAEGGRVGVDVGDAQFFEQGQALPQADEAGHVGRAGGEAFGSRQGVRS